MIKQLRRKILILLMILLSLIFIGILVIINYFNYSFNIKQQISQFRHTSSKIGVEEFCIDAPASSRLDDWQYGTVSFQADSPSRVLVNRLDGCSDEQLLAYTDAIRSSHSYSGSTHSLVYVRKYYQRSSVIIFLSNDYALDNSRNLMVISMIFGILGLVALFLLSAFLARWLTAPVVYSLEAQKRFISDAGHELKTPLTIISSSVDLLESNIDNKKSLQYIRSETNRMTVLVNELLTLARIGNTSVPDSFQTFSLSSALMGVALPFESLAYENLISFEVNIDESILFYGNKEQIQRLLSILLDNAFHYTDENGKIQVSVVHAHKKIVLTVANTGEPIPQEKRDKIFQRFYRVNEARETEHTHYGLGLSIAHSIVERHRGKITVDCANGITSFQVILPC